MIKPITQAEHTILTTKPCPHIKFINITPRRTRKRLLPVSRLKIRQITSKSLRALSEENGAERTSQLDHYFATYIGCEKFTMKVELKEKNWYINMPKERIVIIIEPME